MKTLDLHNIKHSIVEDKLAEFLNWEETPLKIITGNSEKMREMAKEMINKYGYICYYESAYNHGALIVVEKEE